MSDAKETAATDNNVRRLSDAIREVKNAMADRDDVVVELREAERTRLELLAQELDGVADEAPKEHPVFDFAISSGALPRYWINSVAHVDMGRDRRTYRFVRDTRLGRTVLAEIDGDQADRRCRDALCRGADRGAPAHDGSSRRGPRDGCGRTAILR